MSSMQYTSYFFVKNKQRNLAKDFLIKMSPNIYSKTIEQMKLLEKYGLDTSRVSIKKFQNGIWKIRTKDASNNVRLFFYIIDNHIYYLFGFYKSTQKTPEGMKIKINNLKNDLIKTINEVQPNNEYFEKIKF